MRCEVKREIGENDWEKLRRVESVIRGYVKLRLNF